MTSENGSGAGQDLTGLSDEQVLAATGEADKDSTEPAEPRESAAESVEADTASTGNESTGNESTEAESTGAESGEAGTAGAGEQAPEDPVAALRAELRAQPGDWYVVHSYAGYENKVKTNLEHRRQTLDVEDYIFQIEVPTEEVTEIKNGQRKIVQRKVLPGYILVRMELNDASWSAVRNTPGVTGFVGATSRPSPLSLDEVLKFLAPQVTEPEPEKAAQGEPAAAAAEAPA
ncbi:transcription termination/antitermination NusG family protein, partial [Saccharomonospora saliphila]|uniref:transcription termination/antitermination NusG family protein n=1 Tax=Saccharomonospora saliphila TaxID=369829 RepID=UPI00035E6165